MSNNPRQTGRKKISKRKAVLEQINSQQTGIFNKQRIGIGFFLIVVLFIVLVFRLAYWQIVRADDLHEKAVSMQKEDTALDPIRGAIYDTNMKPLAQTVTKYELYGYTQYLYGSEYFSEEEKSKNLSGLAEITGKSEEEIKKLLTGEENPVKLASGLNNNQIDKAQELFGDSVIVRTMVTRSYPNGDFASHVIGCVTDENSGRIGLELEYNSVLAGVKGRVVRTTDSQGNTLSLGHSKYFPAQNGYNIVTTIDTVIQSYVEEEIRAGMKEYGAESIAAIVMDPKTGGILAMAKTPSFDPNEPTLPSDPEEKKKFKTLSVQEQNDYISRMWTNTSVSGLYEPGSTFKLVCSASGLDSGTSRMDSSFYCPGSINIDSIILHCADGHVHGQQDLKAAVGNSCNVALSTIAMDMGRDNYYNYLKLFGYLDYTNIDLPAEAHSLVKDKDTITNVDFASMGFGQGIAVTPIQMITAVSAIANDGKLMQPKLVRQITNSEDKVVEERSDTAVRQVISKETSDEMKETMLYSVNKGGGLMAYVPGYRVGGKTGTADIPDESGGYEGGNISSFVAAAPMDDPQVSVIVIVTRPTKGASHHGAYNAAPMAGKIIERTLTYKGVERIYSEDEEKTKAAKEITVPDVTGSDSKAAIAAIEAAGLKYRIEPANTSGSFKVVDQYPKANQKAEKGSTVYIYSE